MSLWLSPVLSLLHHGCQHVVTLQKYHFLVSKTFINFLLPPKELPSILDVQSLPQYSPIYVHLALLYSNSHILDSLDQQFPYFSILNICLHYSHFCNFLLIISNSQNPTHVLLPIPAPVSSIIRSYKFIWMQGYNHYILHLVSNFTQCCKAEFLNEGKEVSLYIH